MKKPDFRKLKFKMWLYFTVFILSIIAFVWIFQLALLEGYYRREKISSMRDYSVRLQTKTGNDGAFETIAQTCREAGVNVYLVKIDHAAAEYILKYPSGASFSNLSATESSTISRAVESLINAKENEVCDVYQAVDPNDQDKRQSVFYSAAAILNTNGEVDCYLVLTSSRERLSETVFILRTQFILVTAVVVVIGFFLAWYLAGKLSKPIDEMSAVAKKWAEGDSSVTFRTEGSYTEINELGKTLNYAKDCVIKSGMLQRDLLANVSHDLKTPLTMIKAYAEMIGDFSGNDPEKRAKHAQVIIEEADRLAMLVTDILNLSKLQSAVETFDPQEFDLSELTEKVIGRFSDYVENRGYQIEDHIAPDLITVADEKKIEQVIYNLLGNSINYTGEDKVVKVYLTAENDKILLEIIDSGKGISAEKLPTIWDRYKRISETNSRPVKGTGLGLSIVKAILDNHKLKYGVRSKKDCGSNFFVEFNRVKNE